MANAIYKAFFDRSTSGIDGAFTLQVTQNGETDKIFERLPARSGQRGYTKTDWIRGKSPCPFGAHRLWLKPVPLQMKPVGTDFFPISTGENRGLIKGRGQNERWDIGLHMENEYPGSAGCIVLVDRKQALEVFAKLKEIGQTQKFIEFIVI